ncbi:hypothetical protein AVEN_20872-1 [Araneus ventricosus]|uniref:LRRCT domain-containing protein n=1 Tax=Araneus ventricosus TaxID=182803 RepID=A0A4Y2R3P6_ARAVE|nr:hypothetical protein AVEN_203635-1 [Araneus ventricosus]GBN70309.1 hypothetical protein AVEN_20872-1 [Araneus ventricosus]
MVKFELTHLMFLVTFLSSYQKIAALPEDIFVDLPMLKIFFFEGNLLSTISEKVFTKSNVFYSFHGNPINCNGNIKWIIEKFRTAVLQGECFEPESLKGRGLKSLKEEDFRYCH